MKCLVKENHAVRNANEYKRYEHGLEVIPIVSLDLYSLGIINY
jgi:hypothetical protein